MNREEETDCSTSNVCTVGTRAADARVAAALGRHQFRHPDDDARRPSFDSFTQSSRMACIFALLALSRDYEKVSS